MEVLVTAVLVMLAYLAGLLSFKIKIRWCPVCGAVKSCPTCTGWAKTTRAPSDERPVAKRDGHTSDKAATSRGRRSAP